MVIPHQSVTVEHYLVHQCLACLNHVFQQHRFLWSPQPTNQLIECIAARKLHKFQNPDRNFKCNDTTNKLAPYETDGRLLLSANFKVT